jgi:DNA-binding MarR family transcriptional regulator
LKSALRKAAAAAPSRPLGEVLSFMRLLWAVAHGLESTSIRMRKSVGVTGPQRLVVRLIGHYGETTPGDLASVLHVHPSSLTGVVRRLERAKLVRRVADPTDRRRALLTLTKRGQLLNDERAGTVEGAVRETLRGLPPTKLEAVREVLATLAGALGVPRELREPRRS